MAIRRLTNRFCRISRLANRFCRISRSDILLFVTVLAVCFVVQYSRLVLSRMLREQAPLNVREDVPKSTGLRITPLHEPLLDEKDPGISRLKDASIEISEKDELYSYKSPIRPLKLVSGFDTEILLFSAIAFNSTDHTTWDKIGITGWEAGFLKNRSFVCCVAFASGAIKSFPAIKLSRDQKCPMEARQFMCHLGQTNLNDLPVAATITDAKKPVCHRYTATYVDVEYSYVHPEEVAIFGKVTYGNVSAHDLLTWIEIHRLHGVNKFFIYPYEVPSDAMKVLRYYQRQRLVDVIPYARHTTGSFKDVGWDQYHNDQHVTLYDGLLRLRGYKYMVNFDIDEYILSRKGGSWIALFDKLFNKTPDAGAFWFQTYMFIKNWDATNTTSPFTVRRYTMRTDITTDRRKFVVDPRKLQDIGLSTMYNELLDGYKYYMVNHKDAAIHHYRTCRPHWLVNDAKFPCYDVRRTKDETVLNMFKEVEKDIINVVTKTGI